MENLRGAAFMVLAMFCFAVEDALIKGLSDSIPAGQVLSLICFGGLLAFIAWSVLRGQAVWHRDYLDTRVILRSLCEVVGSCFFVSALALIPLTTASAVIQATPLVVAMGAAVFLGQAVGWRRWLAIAAGFVGVLIIIRPGLDGFVPATLLAVGGMLGLAARDLITRSLQVDLTGVQLGIHAFAFVAPAAWTLVIALGQTPVMPDQNAWMTLLGGVIIGMLAYLAIVTATRSGNAGIISSFRYSRMIFALIIGYFAFAEIPDTATLIGATIVIASGIYTLWREARLARSSKDKEPAL
ncbi:MAG: DMT family transporter [Pseudomonadota bacterium]